MKKAAYYARVSTSLQEEQGTIESQKVELQKQILTDGNVMVKEYIDDGWSGGRLDRPALDELRRDLKENIFDVVYFHDSDRIARDVAYQNIIINELLKHGKEIIIKGKNYIHNPENKFTLTVLGAVNELEKAKISERMTRGKREKARRGAIVSSAKPFGYRHILKTEDKHGYLEISEPEAEIVRLIFETYGTTTVSLNGIIKMLETKGIKTPQGKTHWYRNTIRYILMNPSYYGDHYFSRTEKIEPINGQEERADRKYVKTKKTSTRLREKDQWIKISIPPIISKELFETVQEKLKRNKKLLRKGNGRYMLSGLVFCGCCNHIYSGITTPYKRYYRCNYRDKQYSHIADFGTSKCLNQSIMAKDIEEELVRSLEEKILQPTIIKQYIEILNKKSLDDLQPLKDDLARLPKQIEDIAAKKSRILDLYAEGQVPKADYINKITEIDQQNVELLTKNQKLKEAVLLIEQQKGIKLSLNEYINRIKKNYQGANHDQKTFILRTLIKNVVLYKNDTEYRIVINGRIPVKTAAQNEYCVGEFNSVALYHSTTPEFNLKARSWRA